MTLQNDDSIFFRQYSKEHILNNVLLLIFWVKLQNTFHITVWIYTCRVPRPAPHFSTSSPTLHHVLSITATIPGDHTCIGLSLIMGKAKFTFTHCWPLLRQFRYTGHLFGWWSLFLVCLSGWLCFHLLLRCMSFLYVLDINPLSHMWYLNFSLRLPVHLIDCFLGQAEVYRSGTIPLVSFGFVVETFNVINIFIYYI